ncbi:MAG: CRISPR-associated endonuclease Cas2 [Bacteroidota bacterium]
MNPSASPTEQLLKQFRSLWQKLNYLLRRRSIPDDEPKLSQISSGNQEEWESVPRPKPKVQEDSHSHFGLLEFTLDDPMDPEVLRVQRLFEEINLQLSKASSKPVPRLNSQKSQKSRAPAAIIPLQERVKAVKDIFESFPSKPKSTMICFIMYDITDNKIRKKIADYLEEKGCYRVQKSIFLGQLDRKVYREIQDALWQIQQTYDNEDSILFVPVSEDEIKAMRIIGKEVNVPFMLQRGNSVFF